MIPCIKLDVAVTMGNHDLMVKILDWHSLDRTSYFGLNRNLTWVFYVLKINGPPASGIMLIINSQ